MVSRAVQMPQKSLKLTLRVSQLEGQRRFTPRWRSSDPAAGSIMIRLGARLQRERECALPCQERTREADHNYHVLVGGT